MQRRQQEQSPERDARQRRASADRASDAPAPFRPRESPPSPTVADLVRHTPRSSIGPRDSRRELNLDSDDESDLGEFLAPLPHFSANQGAQFTDLLPSQT
jgi:hypothetical protein